MIGLEAILGGIVAALVAVAVAFFRGRSAGAQAERARLMPPLVNPSNPG
jgi:hypothetical protein